MENIIEGDIVVIIWIVIGSLILFIVGREFFLWYFRINDFIKVLDLRLKDIADNLKKDNQKNDTIQITDNKNN